MTVSVGTATPTSAAAPVEARIALMERGPLRQDRRGALKNLPRVISRQPRCSRFGPRTVLFCPLWVTPAGPAVDEIGPRRARSTCRRFTRAEVQGGSVVVVRAYGCGSLSRTLITGRYDERPSPESSPLAVSGGRAEAQRSRPERPALFKSAVGPARDCGPPGSDAPLEPRLAVCCAGVRSTAGVGSRARSSPLPSGPPSVRPFVRQHGPAPAKASAPSPPTCPKSCCTSASWSASSMCATMPCSCCLCFRRAARPHRGADKMARWFWLARQG